MILPRDFIRKGPARRDSNREAVLLLPAIRMCAKEIGVHEQDPVERDGVAILGRATGAQRPIAALSADQFDLAAGDDSSATQAAPPVIERVPFPELIESAQGVEFLGGIYGHELECDCRPEGPWLIAGKR